MESLAYLHLALPHCRDAQFRVPTAENSQSESSQTHFSGATLLSVLLAVSVMSIASEANARPSGVVTYAIQPGDRGEEVLVLQEYLQKLGYFEAHPTGYFGETTKAAVIRYQKEKGLYPDGIVGRHTLFSFCADRKAQQSPKQYSPTPSPPPNPYLSSKQTPSPSTSEVLNLGNHGEKVTWLQQRLQALSYFSGPITGYFGPQTRQAVIQFQQDRSLTPDGIVGTNTLEALKGTNTVATSNNIQANDKVKQLQQRLSEAGFYDGPLDGLWGPRTQQAIEAAQQSYGIITR